MSIDYDDWDHWDEREDEWDMMEDRLSGRGRKGARGTDDESVMLNMEARYEREIGRT